MAYQSPSQLILAKTNPEDLWPWNGVPGGELLNYSVDDLLATNHMSHRNFYRWPLPKYIAVRFRSVDFLSGKQNVDTSATTNDNANVELSDWFSDHNGDEVGAMPYLILSGTHTSSTLVTWSLLQPSGSHPLPLIEAVKADASTYGGGSPTYADIDDKIVSVGSALSTLKTSPTGYQYTNSISSHQEYLGIYIQLDLENKTVGIYAGTNTTFANLTGGSARSFYGQFFKAEFDSTDFDADPDLTRHFHAYTASTGDEWYSIANELSYDGTAVDTTDILANTLVRKILSQAGGGTIEIKPIPDIIPCHHIGLNGKYQDTACARYSVSGDFEIVCHDFTTAGAIDHGSASSFTLSGDLEPTYSSYFIQLPNYGNIHTLDEDSASGTFRVHDTPSGSEDYCSTTVLETAGFDNITVTMTQLTTKWSKIKVDWTVTGLTVPASSTVIGSSYETWIRKTDLPETFAASMFMRDDNPQPGSDPYRVLFALYAATFTAATPLVPEVDGYSFSTATESTSNDTFTSTLSVDVINAPLPLDSARRYTLSLHTRVKTNQKGSVVDTFTGLSGTSDTAEFFVTLIKGAWYILQIHNLETGWHAEIARLKATPT